MKVSVPVEKECVASWLAYGPSFKKRLFMGGLIFQKSIPQPKSPPRAAEQMEDVFTVLPQLKPKFEVPTKPVANTASVLFTLLGCMPLLAVVILMSKQGASPIRVWMTLFKETPHYIPIMIMAVSWVAFCLANWIYFEIHSTLIYGSFLALTTLIVCTWSFRRDHLK